MSEQREMEKGATREDLRQRAPVEAATKAKAAEAEPARSAKTDKLKEPCKDSSRYDLNQQPICTDGEQTADFSVETPKTYSAASTAAAEASAAKRAKRGRAPRVTHWTKSEDESMARGYQQYGFQWTAMTRDPTLNLARRTGPQVRDRFRLKFPAHYQDSVPLPLPDGTERPPRIRSARAARRAEAARGELQLHVVWAKGASRPAEKGVQAPATSANPGSGPGEPGPVYQSPYAPMGRTTQAARAQEKGPTTQRPSSPLASESAGTTTASEVPPERRPAAPLPVERLPSSRTSDSLQDRDREESPTDAPSPDEPDETETETVRHMGILGLLNDDADVVAPPTATHGAAVSGSQSVPTGYTGSNGTGDGTGDGGSSRLPPFKSTFEEWSTVEDSVELPPLLWEDMASRPIFELD